MSSPLFDDPCLKWRKSSRSTGSGTECVEIARVPGAIGIRDSKNPDGAKLSFAPQIMRSLSRQIKESRIVH